MTDPCGFTEERDKLMSSNNSDDYACHSESFVMKFGKYKGSSLGSISNVDPSYILWLADNNILSIDARFLDSVRTIDIENHEAFWEAIRDDS